MSTYNVNETGFDSYMDAVQHAKAIGAKVIQNDNGLTRWTPILKPANKTIMNVLKMADGSFVPMTRANIAKAQKGIR